MKKLLVIITLFASYALAQTPLQITPYQVIDARTGQAIACVGCQIFSYAAGTVTPLATYTDASLTTLNTDPVVTDSAGFASNGSSITGIWVGRACYKIVLEDINSVVIWTQDNVCPAGFQSTAPLNAIDIAQNALGNSGGYISFQPITYNPNNGAPCTDAWGNLVSQPVVSPNLPAFGPATAVLWVGGSPVVPASGVCGPALPVLTTEGLDTNGYVFARGGIATDLNAYNSIQSLLGGFAGGAFTAGVLYPAGTITTGGTLSAATVLGGYLYVGHSSGPPAIGTISTVTNPFITGQSLGTFGGFLYYDDGLNCFNGWNGTTWNCIGGSGGSGTPGGPTNSVQISAGSSFFGSANFKYDPALSLLTVLRTGTSSGIISPSYIANIAGVANTFENSDGSFRVTSVGGVQVDELQTGQNNSVLATAGNGAVINRVGSPISTFMFDSGGVCTIGTGNISPGISCSSDQRLKTRGVSIGDGLSSVMRLHPVSFNWLANGEPGIGFIAQEVEKVLPQLVSFAPDNNHLMLSEEGIIPYLVRAIQQQQAEIKALNDKISHTFHYYGTPVSTR